MKSIIQRLWMFIAVLCVSLSASAYDFKVDGLCYNILSEREGDFSVEVTCEFVGIDNMSYVAGDIDIPREVVYNSTTYTVTSVGYRAFLNCSNLVSVTIPNSVIYIGIFAFGDCHSLTSVTIPHSVTTIENDAFYGCKNLRTIYMECETPVTCRAGFSEEVYNEAILYVPVGTKAEYQKVEPWKNFKNIWEMDFSSLNTINPDNNDPIRVSVNNGILTIEGIDARENISICDMRGRIVFHGASRTVDHLPSGLYIVKAGSKAIKVSL